MDIALSYQAEAMRIDALLQNDLIVTDESLLTSLIISLFTDKLAGSDDELPPTESWRRGWWGDNLTKNHNDQIGSHLWLLFRCKQTEETRQRAEEYTRASLTWMIEDNIVKDFNVIAKWVKPVGGILGINITINKTNANTERYFFSLNTEKWEAFSHAV